MQLIPNQKGISMVEILISIFILSIGLLGLVALQNSSLKMALNAHQRTQANFLAQDLFDRIRANSNASTYLLNQSSSFEAINCFSGQTCSIAQLKQFDLYHWLLERDRLLPSASSTLTFDDSTKTYTLTLAWDSRYDSEKEEFKYSFKIQ